MILGIAIVVGIVLVVGFFLVVFGAAMLGIPLESKKKRDARAALAAQIQAQRIEAEAARNLAVRQAEQRLAEGQ